MCDTYALAINVERVWLFITPRLYAHTPGRQTVSPKLVDCLKELLDFQFSFHRFGLEDEFNGFFKFLDISRCDSRRGVIAEIAILLRKHGGKTELENTAKYTNYPLNYL